MTAYEVRFLVDNFSVDSPEQVGALYGHFDAAVSRICESTVITLGVEVPEHVDALDAIRAEMVAVESATGLRAVEVDLDLVDEGEIAARLDKSRQVINLCANSARGYRDFPRPYSLPGGRRVWTWASVARWARVHKPGWDDADEPEHLSREQQRELDAWLTNRSAIPQATGYDLLFAQSRLACTQPFLRLPLNLGGHWTFSSQRREERASR